MKKNIVIGLSLLLVWIALMYVLGTNVSVGIAGYLMGYALARGYYGFAGSVNRAYRMKSFRLMQSMLELFIFCAILMAVFFFVRGGYDGFKLKVYPLNLGAVIGGLLFGIGMAMASCCGSGTLAELGESTTKGFIVLVGFCAGAFLGFRAQGASPLVTEGPKVFFPDLVESLPLGLLLGVLITVVLALFFKWITSLVEKSVNGKNTVRLSFEEPIDNSKYPTLLEKIFVRPFSLREAVVAIGLAYLLINITAKTGWGVTTGFGYWFGKFLVLLGVDVEAVSQYSTRSVDFFMTPLMQSNRTLLNFGLIIGTVSALIMIGGFKPVFKIKLSYAIFVLLGGFIMGIGTRFGNGCNAGALLSPISHFSLSGWLFFVFMVTGGILGNMAMKRLKI
ncbi:MAG: hypothetical protein B0D92_00030 [Spirochaeta sp. LUC14_002_19_P3]|nr:MAG: hypothetical protein B0D92_00030 [Spirochaeta sp. LUC14_002_19_P3]